MLESLIAAQKVQDEVNEKAGSAAGSVLENHMHMLKTFWWQEAEPRSGLSLEVRAYARENSIPLFHNPNVGPETQVQYDSTKRSLLWHTVEQLERGIKIPWRFREFGARAAELMLQMKLPIGRAHYGKKGSGMLSPTLEERETYEILYDMGTMDNGGYVVTETRLTTTY